MAQITTYSQLRKILEKQLKDSLTKAGNDIKKMLINFVEKKWYLGHSESEYYDRTMDVLNSITASKVEKDSNGKYSVTIFFDSNKISHDHRDGFSAHMSFDGGTTWGGDSISELVVLWMDQGNGHNPKFPQLDYEGVGFMQDTKEYAEKNLARLLARYLRMYGYSNVKVTVT